MDEVVSNFAFNFNLSHCAKVGEIEAAEKQKMANKCQKIAAHGQGLTLVHFSHQT
jgi:hypothetical protein